MAGLVSTKGSHMSKHRKIRRTERASVRQYLATGVGGAALVGVGVLLTALPSLADHSRSRSAAGVFRLGLRTPAVVPARRYWWLGDGRLHRQQQPLFGASITPNFTPTALAAASAAAAGSTSSIPSARVGG